MFGRPITWVRAARACPYACKRPKTRAGHAKIDVCGLQLVRAGACASMRVVFSRRAYDSWASKRLGSKLRQVGAAGVYLRLGAGSSLGT